MRTRRRKKVDEKLLAESTTRYRKAREVQSRQRYDLIEAALLGLDDGTEEAALNEELDFGKFLDAMDEEYEEHVVRSNDAQRDRPVLEEQKRFRERLPGLKTWR